MFIKTTDFNGSLTASNDPVAAGSNIMCPMGDGEYEYENLEMEMERLCLDGKRWHGILLNLFVIFKEIQRMGTR